jgi:hypothetical protein
MANGKKLWSVCELQGGTPLRTFLQVKPFEATCKDYETPAQQDR